ncbi:uncharacterized protein LOC144106176 [Amblyomma americanum]
MTLLNITVFAALLYICPPTPRFETLCRTSCKFEDTLFAYLERGKTDEVSRVASARLVHREMCYVMLTTLGNIHHMVLQTFQALFPREDAGFLNKICLEATFAKIQFISKAVTSEPAFVDFARETAATLCCLNALLWESLLRLVVGKSSVKQSLCVEYYHRKAERFQELYFSCARDRCASVLSSQGCLTGAYRSLAKAIREFQFSSVVPPLEAFCPDVDECPSRPVVVFEENYDRFGDLCPLCGLIPQYAGCISEVHLGVQSRAGGNGSPGAGPAAAVVAHHPRSMSTSGSPTRCYTPMLFSNSQVADPASTPPVRKMPVETDKRAYDRYRKLKLRLNLFGSTNWVMSDPEFVNLADRSLVFRQLHGSCEAIGAVYRSAEPIHFVVFVNGLGGKSSDFFWAKRWMKLLIATPKHILIWSEANEQEQTFDEISVCGARLAIEVASYLDNIGTTNFKLSFVGFSLGCVLVRAALTCAQLRPYIRNLHTFFSLNGPHLGVVYAKNRFLRFQISVLSKISMKGSMKELTFQDSADIRKCYLYILSRAPGLEYFKNVLLVGSSQDKLVPVHSSNIQHCPESLVDNSVVGKTYDEMIKNLLGPLLKREDVTLKRFDVFYDTGRLRYLEPVFISLSHVCALMSRNLFEKFMLLSAAECFK